MSSMRRPVGEDPHWRVCNFYYFFPSSFLVSWITNSKHGDNLEAGTMEKYTWNLARKRYVIVRIMKITGFRQKRLRETIQGGEG